MAIELPPDLLEELEALAEEDRELVLGLLSLREREMVEAALGRSDVKSAVSRGPISPWLLSVIGGEDQRVTAAARAALGQDMSAASALRPDRLGQFGDALERMSLVKGRTS